MCICGVQTNDGCQLNFVKEKVFNLRRKKKMRAPRFDKQNIVKEVVCQFASY